MNGAIPNHISLENRLNQIVLVQEVVVLWWDVSERRKQLFQQPTPSRSSNRSNIVIDRNILSSTKENKIDLICPVTCQVLNKYAYCTRTYRNYSGSGIVE